MSLPFWDDKIVLQYVSDYDRVEELFHLGMGGGAGDPGERWKKCCTVDVGGLKNHRT
uniref:Uncharacterized protein n=1 Tax=Anguilla anguilla TaxID=7936 RepID=A0A0E9UX73_ANGAN